MDYKTIIYNLNAGILTITLNRPEKLNAFNRDMQNELIDAFDQADNDDNVRAIIVTGAGRAFCAGADLEAGGNTFNADGRSDRDSGLNPDGGGLVTLRIHKLNKPIIAAINGPAVGVGITMTLAMDIRLAAESAKFGFVFSRRGIVPEACSSYFLPRIVGISQALEWCYSGRVFGTEEALNGRLISNIYSKDELMVKSQDLATSFKNETSAVSVTLIRHMMWKMLGADHPVEAHNIDSRGVYFTGKSDDAKEGVESFLEKREANFPGKVSQDMPDFFPWWDEKEFS